MRGDAGRLHTVDQFYYEQMPTGLHYEIITALLGFNPLRHAGKVTGLAAFGKPNTQCAAAFDAFFDEMWIRSGRPDRSYEFFRRTREEVGLAALRELRKTEFGAFSREDIAYYIQKRTEDEVREFVRGYQRQFPELTKICLAGGVFANVRVNQEVHRLGFERVFVQPAMSDAGLCYGAALLGFNPLRHAGKVTGLAAFGKENAECKRAFDAFFAEMWQRGDDLVMQPGWHLLVVELVNRVKPAIFSAHHACGKPVAQPIQRHHQRTIKSARVISRRRMAQMVVITLVQPDRMHKPLRHRAASRTHCLQILRGMREQLFRRVPPQPQPRQIDELLANKPRKRRRNGQVVAGMVVSRAARIQVQPDAG
jgi:predicted NodU family carbamoyl transferase